MNCVVDNYDLMTEALPYIVCLEKNSTNFNVKYY
jgi:hypothetical protein